MTDPFTDVADELMTRTSDGTTGDPAGVAAPGSTVGSKTSKKHVCPYCGAVTAVAEKPTGPCPRCTMEDTPATRAATKSRIGPWSVLQSRNPSAPGMKWATLLSLVSKGQVTPRSVVRGPTTHQLWKFAAHVKGLSREFNLCYSCGGEIDRAANQCPHCDRLQEPPVNPDSLLEAREIAPRGNTIQKEIKAGSPIPELSLGGPQGEQAMRRPRNPDEGILSAKELAAAFQLDFNPTVQPNLPTERAKPRPTRAIGILLLLLAICGGALLAGKPDYRVATFAWLNAKFTYVRNSISSSLSSNSKPAAKSMPWDSQAKTSDTATPPLAAEKTSPPPTEASPAPSAVASIAEQTPTPTPEPEHIAPPPAPTPTPTPVSQPPQPEAQQAKTVVVEQAPAKLTAEQQATARKLEQLKIDLDAPIPSGMDSQRDLAQRLYFAGIDADRVQDFPLAVRCYQKIKQLDPSVQETNVDLRLSNAKEQLPQ